MVVATLGAGAPKWHHTENAKKMVANFGRTKNIIVETMSFGMPSKTHGLLHRVF